MKKVNIPVRMRNPWFWIGIGAVILNAMGVDPATFSSWERVWIAIQVLVTNPYQMACVFLAVLAVFVDPTTAGFGDSRRALGYGKPFKDPEI